MKRKLLDAASKVGQGKNALELYDQIFDSPLNIDIAVDDKISEFEMNNKKGEILLPLVRGQWRTPSYCQCILSHALRTRGYEPIVLLCHNDLSMCHRKSPGNEGRSVCDLCNFYGEEILSKFGLRPLSLSDITVEYPSFNPDNINNKIEYHGIQISKFAKATVRKFLRRYTFDLENEYHRNVYKSALNSAAKQVAICEYVIKEKDINAVLGFDPMYNISGIYLAVAKMYDIPSYSVSKGYRDGYIMFGRQESNKLPHPQFTNPEIIQEYLKKPLNKKEFENVENIMKKRRCGSTSTVPYTQIGSSIETKDRDTVVGMFTNLIWDGSLEIETAPFPDVFDWIYTTIDYFIESDKVLIIRTHPVEAMRKTNESVAAAIRQHYSDLPENIILVDPDEDVNTYQLMNDLDVSIVYNSTVGLEMAYNELPVIVGGDTHYRKLGFTYDPNTSEEYVNLLGHLDDLEPKKNTMKKARRYAHFLFIQKHIGFPLYSIDGSVSAELRPVSHQDIKPGNENLDHILDCIVENKPVLRK